MADDLTGGPAIAVPDLGDPAVRAALARAEAGALLGPTDMAPIIGRSVKQFYRLNAQHVYDFLKTRPALGPRCFSGVLVMRWLRGEPVYEPTFGRKRRQA